MITPDLTYKASDPARSHFQYLEDLATAYWYSEVLFAALELKLFDFIESNPGDTNTLARTAGCRAKPLLRLLRVLEAVDLIQQINSCWYNSQLAREYLLSDQSAYLGDFLLYRRYMQSQWQDLVRRVSKKPRAHGRWLSHANDYQRRTFRYAQAMDALARRKRREICDILAGKEWTPPLLDIGGGAGTLGRSLMKTKPEGVGVLFDLPEVVAAARQIYPDADSWRNFHAVGGDFREHAFGVAKSFGLIILGNFLHAYDPAQARLLLGGALRLLAPDGLVLIHDYFPDRRAHHRHKGSLYDLNMMLNTFNGECHPAEQIVDWLRSAGMVHIHIRDLPSDSSVILAGGAARRDIDNGAASDWVYRALKAGFRQARVIPAGEVVTAPWVRSKCRWGCANYEKNLQCPPYGMTATRTDELIRSYRRALIVEGEPPGDRFHNRLLALEKDAFLAGHYKALAFGAGPCPVCKDCPPKGPCRYPDRARPSMEASGIDVYATARQAGIRFEPATHPRHYVKYIGLLLLE